MKRIRLVQIGFGTVGGTLIEQVLDNRQRWREEFDFHFIFCAVGSRHGAIVDDGPLGLADDALRATVKRRRSTGGALDGGHHRFEPIIDVVKRLSVEGPVIVLDAAAGAETAVVNAAALEAGGGVVLSNKAPLALDHTDAAGATLWRHAGAGGRLRYEATCGAGLPVISTLRSLIDSGDDLLEISGALSGTFGAIFSTVAAGATFSEAVRTARDQGYTEPDPRDDLSGLDVARKGLILARTLGHEINLSEIDVHSLVPTDLADGSVSSFLDGLVRLDAEIAEQARDAASAEMSLKYIMNLDQQRRITVGLRQVPRATVLGALQGPENICSIRTRRYDDFPCVISGPGAGAEVTAAGMAVDLLALSSLMC